MTGRLTPANYQTSIMATRTQENFPLQRLDIFSHPTQDDYERAKDKARQLLRSVLLETEWGELEEKGVIQLSGRRGNLGQRSSAFR